MELANALIPPMKLTQLPNNLNGSVELSKNSELLITLFHIANLTLQMIAANLVKLGIFLLLIGLSAYYLKVT